MTWHALAWQRRALLPLVAAIALIYANALLNNFTLDDFYYIAGNPQITQAPWRILIEPHTNSNVYRPLTFLSYAFNYYTGGFEPEAFHFLNLVLHIGVTLLLFWLVRLLLDGEEYVALAAAWLFAVHPIHTEVVTSAVGRSELLAAGLLLAAWIAHLRDREKTSLGLYLLAMTSKESAVVLPALLLLGDYVCAHMKPMLRYVRSAALGVAYLVWLWYVQGGRLGRELIPQIDNPLGEMPVLWRVLNALHVGWKYAAVQIYPRTLSADYSFNAIPVSRSWAALLPALLGTLAVATLWIWAILRRRRGIAIGCGIYFIAFATTSNILIPTGTIMGERLAYLPSAGFCLLVALGWNWLRTRQRSVAFALLAIAVGVLGARTMVRNRDWLNNTTLARATAAAVPDSVKARNALGGILMDANDTTGARAQFEIAYRIDPDYPDLLASYGLLEYRSGHREVAERMMERALGMSGPDNPNYALIATNWAAVLISTGRADNALAILNKVIAESPNYSRALSNRAVINYQRGDLAAARSDAERAFAADHKNKQAAAVLRLVPKR